MACCRRRVLTKTASYTATERDDTILSDDSGASIIITLPTAVGIKGKHFTILRIGNSNFVTSIVPHGTQTISGQTTIVLRRRYEAVEIESDGSNWYITKDNALYPSRDSLDLSTYTSSVAWFASLLVSSLRLQPSATYSITSDRDDFNLTEPAAIHRFASTATYTITGFAHSGSANESNLFFGINSGAHSIVLANENAGSTAAYRIRTGTGADLTIPSNGCFIALYDDTIARWIIVAKNP